LSDLLSLYSGAVDFDYLKKLVDKLRAKGEEPDGQVIKVIVDRLELFIDNMDIENIRSLLSRLHELAAKGPSGGKDEKR